MSPEEQERFENDLRRIRVAPVPEDLAARLRGARIEPRETEPVRPVRAPLLMGWRRWLAVATPLAVGTIFLVRIALKPLADLHDSHSAGQQAFEASAIQVDHTLVSTFDAVAELPGGEPVRFRCRKWVDDFVMKDSSRGLVIEQSRPRVEVTPVRFETY